MRNDNCLWCFLFWTDEALDGCATEAGSGARGRLRHVAVSNAPYRTAGRGPRGLGL